jgi:hypothetical protein
VSGVLAVEGRGGNGLISHGSPKSESLKVRLWKKGGLDDVSSGLDVPGPM